MCFSFVHKEYEKELKEIKKRLKVLEDIGINHTAWFMRIDNDLKAILEKEKNGKEHRKDGASRF